MTEPARPPSEESMPPHFIAAGTTMTLREGTFAGMSGPLAEDWRGEGNVPITLTIFGREVRIDVDPCQLFPCPIPREADWPEGTSLERMLENVRCHASARKMRLCGVACCRRITRLMTETRCSALSAVTSRMGLWEAIDAPPVIGPGFLLRTVEEVERYAESGEGQEEMRRAGQAAWALYSAREHFYQWIDEGWSPADQELLATAGAARAIQHLCESPDPFGVARAASRAVYWAEGGTQRDGADPHEEEGQRRLVRCVFGLPLHARPIEKQWLTISVRGIADALGEDRQPYLLPILADALEDAGCTDAAILDHLRSAGPHVRGCWAVDLVLGLS